MLDYLIIGQGLAGTLVADELLRRGRRIAVVDDGHAASSSLVAAGNVNPVSGRRFTVSHRFADAAPAALAAYERLSRLLERPLVDRRPVLRLFRDQREVQAWEQRAGSPSLAGLECRMVDAASAGRAVHAPFGALLIRDAFQVRLPDLVQGFRRRMLVAGRLIDARCDAAELRVVAHGIRWRDVDAARAIFCEGAALRGNPIWRCIELRPARGEVLHARIPGLEADRVLHRGFNVIPLGGDRFWVGSTVEWDRLDTDPSASGRDLLVQGLQSLLAVPFEIVGHAVGIRPATARRIPVLGRHPETDRLAILNGLGAKGALWAPERAQQLVAHLEDGRPLDADVDVSRAANQAG